MSNIWYRGGGAVVASASGRCWVWLVPERGGHNLYLDISDIVPGLAECINEINYPCLRE